MTTARKLMLTLAAATVALSLTGCSVSFEDPAAKPSGSASPSSGATENPGDPTATASPTTDPEAPTIDSPKPLPTIATGDKPNYSDAAASASLATIISDSAALADAKGWHATVNGKVVGAIPNAKSFPTNNSYVIAPFSLYPAGNAVDLPSGMNPSSLLLVTAGQKYNAFSNLLSILTPSGGTLATFDAKQSPLSDALFAAATLAPSATDAKASDVKYGTSKSFGKYGTTANAYSVLLNPSTAGAFKEVILFVDKVDGKDVIVGVNNVRVGYGAHPTFELGLQEYRPVIESSQTAGSVVALGTVTKYWVDVTSWWLKR